MKRVNKKASLFIAASLIASSFIVPSSGAGIDEVFTKDENQFAEQYADPGVEEILLISEAEGSVPVSEPEALPEWEEISPAPGSDALPEWEDDILILDPDQGEELEELTEAFWEYDGEEAALSSNIDEHLEQEDAPDAPVEELEDTDSPAVLSEEAIEIAEPGFASFNIKDAIIRLPKKPQVYTGSALKPVPTVLLDGGELKNNTDFTLSYANNIEVGEASLTVTGTGSYTGSQTVTFRIYQNGGSVPNSPGIYWSYDGSELQLMGDGAYNPGYTATAPWYNYKNLIQSVVIGEGITELGQYAFDRSHNQEVSAETVTIAASVRKIDGFFRSPNLKHIYFAPRSASQPLQIGYGAFGSIPTLEEVVFPGFPVFLENGAFFNSGNDMLVVLPAAFTGYSRKSTYPELPFVNARIGAFYGYSGTKFDDLVKDLAGSGFPVFYRDLDHLDITLSQDAYYADGNPHYPKVTLQTKNDDTGRAFLTEGVDFTVSYDGRVEPGTAKITLTGIGYVEGSREISYQILSDEAKCGDNLVWILSEDGTLSINGTGDMYDYASSAVTPWASQRTAVRKVVFKDGVTGIGAFACADMPMLEKAQIPATVTKVGTKAFFNTPKLLSLTLGDQVTAIGDKAVGFISNTALTPGFELLCSATGAAGTYAANHKIANDDPAMFLDGTAGNYGVSYKVRKHGKQLTFYLNERAKTCAYTGIDSTGTYGKDSPWLIYKDTIEEVLIEDGIQQIYAYVFKDLSKVKELILPESVTYISSAVFQNLESLETLKLPKDLYKKDSSSGTETFYADTFSNLPSLKTLVIPDGVTRLSSKAINRCTGLQYVYIPISVTTIEDQAIYGNTKLTVYGWAGTAAETYAAAPDSTIPARKYDFIDADLGNAKISLAQTFYNYDGTAKTPEVTVRLGDVVLKKGTDYMVLYENNVKIGTATVKVSGAGFVQGSQTVQFTIQAPKDIEVIPAVDYYVYDGKAKKPKVTVKDAVGTIASNRYTVTYSNNKDVGIATITVKLKAPYNATVNGSFRILPKKTKIKKLTTPKSKQIKVTWKKQAKQTTGYKIQYSLKKDFTSAKTITVKGASKTSYTIKNLKKGKTYYIRIQTYRRKNGVTVNSLWSTKKTVRTK